MAMLPKWMLAARCLLSFNSFMPLVSVADAEAAALAVLSSRPQLARLLVSAGMAKYPPPAMLR